MNQDFLLFLWGLAKLFGIFVIIAIVAAAIYGFFERRSKRPGKYTDKMR